MSSHTQQNDALAPQSTTDLLKTAKFATSGAVPDAAPVSANDLLLGAYDPSRLHPLAGISDQVDYLMLEDDKLTDMPGSETAIPSRGWSDDLCYGTGTMYLGGRSFIVPLLPSTLALRPFLRLLCAPPRFPYLLILLSRIPSHADPHYPQVWVWVAFGVFGRAPAGPSQCQTPACESMPS